MCCVGDDKQAAWMTLLQPQRFAERYAIGAYFRGVSWSRSGRWAPAPKLVLRAAGLACFLL